MARSSRGSNRGFSKFRSKWWALCRIDRKVRSGRPCTAAILAEDLEVDRRTIRRYIAFMREELGAPIQFDPIEQRYELTDSAWTMPNVHLTDAELVALAVATRSVAACAPAPFAARLEELLAKLIDALPSDQRGEIASLLTKVDFKPVSVPSNGAEWVEPLIHGMRDRIIVEVEYFVLNKEKLTRRYIDPYHLRYFSGAWYLIGYDHHTKHIPVFHLGRVRSLRLTDDTFKQRPFNVHEYFRHTFGITAGGDPKPVRVLLTGRAARTADERIWPEGFTYISATRSRGVLTGTVGHLDDIAAWAASFDGDARILPDEP
jgi:predicted DNA-binding transcriptional regulator YafY